MATLPTPPGDLPPEQLFLGHLKLINEVITHVCRRSHFSKQEAEDFGQDVRCKLIENNYAVLREYQGRSSMRTYLTVVIGRLLLDKQNSLWGKWRPSAEAERLGRVAIRLEMLLFRDGYSYGEACQILLTNEKVEMSEEELDQLRAKLPPRNLRQFVGEEQLQSTPTRDPDPAESLEAREWAELGRRLAIALNRALDTLPDEDQILVRMRSELSVADIARKRRMEQKPLYRRLEKNYEKLRKVLDRQGVRRQDVEEILRWLQPDFLDF